MSPQATPAPASRTLATGAHSPTRAMERWVSPTELERRLEAHLLIARRIRR